MTGVQTCALPISEFQVNVTLPTGEKVAVTPRKSAGERGTVEHSAEFINTSAPGDYWVSVTARVKSDSVGFDAYTRFIVDARDLELDYPSADYEFLKELSSITGGVSLKPEEVGDLLDRLKETKTDLTRIQSITLWDNWGMLLAFVCLMSLEWFLRKKRGLV